MRVATMEEWGRVCGLAAGLLALIGIRSVHAATSSSVAHQAFQHYQKPSQRYHSGQPSNPNSLWVPCITEETCPTISSPKLTLHRPSVPETTKIKRGPTLVIETKEDNASCTSALWDEELESLVAFQKQHGHMRIPKSETRLYRFVKNLRQNYNYLRKAKKNRQSNHLVAIESPMHRTAQSLHETMSLESVSTKYPFSLTPERIRRLEAIRFHWNPRQESWQSKYKQLLEFYNQHGHVGIPNHPQYADLKHWMAYQRLRYRQSDKTSGIAPLTNEQIQILEDLQFSWTPQEENWWSKFHQLQDFYKTHGHWNVRSKDNHSLRCWKNTLRSQCREYVFAVSLEGSVEGVHVSGLTQERIQALRKASFCWLPDPASKGRLEEDPPKDIFNGYQ